MVAANMGGRNKHMNGNPPRPLLSQQIPFPRAMRPRLPPFQAGRMPPPLRMRMPMPPPMFRQRHPGPPRMMGPRGPPGARPPPGMNMPPMMRPPMPPPIPPPRGRGFRHRGPPMMRIQQGRVQKPVRKKNKNKQPSMDVNSPWVTEAIKSAFIQKDSLLNMAKETQKPQDWELYKKQKDTCYKMFQAAKMEYIGQHPEEDIDKIIPTEQTATDPAAPS